MSDELKEPLRGTVLAVCMSPRKGIPKALQERVELLPDYGVKGDRHAGSRTRQVSLLEAEVLDALAAEGMAVGPGVLGENLTVRGLPLARVRPGGLLCIGETALLEAVEPRTPCKTLTPVHPRLPAGIVGRAGLLCRVLEGGVVTAGDAIVVEPE